MNKNAKVAVLLGLLVAAAVGAGLYRLSIWSLQGSVEVHAWVGTQEVTANAKITKGWIMSVNPLEESYSHYTPYTFPNLSNGYWFLEVKYQDQPTQSKGITIDNNSFREDFYFTPSNDGTLTIHAYLDNGDVGATITIDGVAGSWTTGVVLTLSAGEYTVHAHFLSYPDKTENATVFANQYVDLNFYWYSSPVTCTLTVTAGNGGDTDSGGANYLEQGDSIDVTAAPRQGFTFNHWTLDGVNVGQGTDNGDGTFTYHFMQSDQQNHVLIAVFTDEGSFKFDQNTFVLLGMVAVVVFVVLAAVAIGRARRRN